MKTALEFDIFVQQPLTQNRGDRTAEKRVSEVPTCPVVQCFCFASDSSGKVHWPDHLPSGRLKDAGSLLCKIQKSEENDYRIIGWTADYMSFQVGMRGEGREGRRAYLTLSLPSSKSTFPQLHNGSIIIFHLSERWKAKFFILCDVIFLVRLQEKFEIDHSWEWKG